MKTYISLFSGAGGFSIGFNSIGYKCLLASDIDEDAEKTHLLNFPETPFIRRDISQLPPSEIIKIIGKKIPDVIIGGPPCQGFSMMGDKHGSDPRNQLFKYYVNIVASVKPKCFVFENVLGLVSLHKGKFLLNLAKDFSIAGYDIYFRVLDSANYGVPQHRKRVILFGTRLDKRFIYPEEKNETIGDIIAYNNVGEAINNLTESDKNIKNHIPLNHTDIVLARYKLIPEGGKLPDAKHLPENIRRKNFGSTYTRLHRERKSVTLVPGNNAFPIHPTLDRSLTPREAARIQTFPDKHTFVGSRRKQCILVGNAVPPLLAANIALAVDKHFRAKSGSSRPEEIYSPKSSNNVSVPVISHEMQNKKYTFVDLFCGAGGITIGLNNAGFRPLLACDSDSSVAKTHALNFPSIEYVNGDLSNNEINSQIIKKLSDKKITLLAGGPPCQGFSIFGKRRFINTRNYDPSTDPRNKLVFTYLEYLKKLQPDWFLLENVPGFANLDKGHFLTEIIKRIKRIGYKDLDWRIINTADYGIPQKRKRFILIANKTGNIIPWPKPKYFDKPEPWQFPHRTVGEVITDLSDETSSDRFKNHDPMKHSTMITERYSYVEEGKKMDVEKLPEKLRYAKMTGQKIKNFSHVYRRLHRNEPSITLVPGHNAFPIHPWLNRLLTVREAARIQTFPDNLEFVGSSKDQCIQVGNAFPCMMAERIGESIIKAIENNWKKENISKLANYSILDKWYLEKKQKSFNFN
ncbi:MAG: DNA cytosine methyltransferase [Rickettsiales bacterium]|nr:DNA cytosine methyltransferase [Rickettsiales bacterium]